MKDAIVGSAIHVIKNTKLPSADSKIDNDFNLSVYVVSADKNICIWHEFI